MTLNNEFILRCRRRQKE